MNGKEETKEFSEYLFLTEEDVGYAEEEKNDEVVSIDKPYDPKLVDIGPQTLTISNIVRRLKEDAIDLYPDFQRSANLWNPQKQSLLIESILIRIPLPAFYFDGINIDKWQIIDGLQRLCVFNNFIVKKELKLVGLEYLNQFEGFTFDKLPATYQRQIEETNLNVFIMKSGTQDVKFNIFKRINTGGIALNAQEIRNALNQGVATDFIAELASSDLFKQVTSISSQRMLDKEFITRFITFYISKPEDYKPDLDLFMSNAMGKLNQLSQPELDAIRKNFMSSLSLAKEVFGQWAFRKVSNKQEKFYPRNKSLFEVWSILFAKLSDAERQVILLKKEDVFDDYIKLINNDVEFVRAITSQTDNRNKVIYRFSTIDKLIKNRLS